MNKNLDYYMSLPYRVDVIPDGEEGGFALHCPDLNGCTTCAETLEDGLKLLEDAKRCWFTACLEDGIPIPEPEGFDLYGLLQDGLADVANGNTSPLSETIGRIRRSRTDGISLRYPRGGQ